VLDRIDYNCESVLVKAKEGRKEMEKVVQREVRHVELSLASIAGQRALEE